jgi:hypothetical protein
VRRRLAEMRNVTVGAGSLEQRVSLRELSDPEFITHWAAVRLRLALSSVRDAEHARFKHLYDDALAEYRRRMDGALAAEHSGN